MRWVVALLGLAAGCRFELPPGMVVDDGPVGGEGSGSDMGGGDACPSGANPHDEDGDGVVDVCDLCPQIANAPALDSDLDGIPDACDPHIATTGDVLLAFEPFAVDGPAPAGWQARGGGSQNDWVVGGDALRITSPDDNTRLLIFDTTFAAHTIDVGFEIVSVVGGGFEFITAVGDVRSDVSQFMGCGIRVDNQTPAPDRELIRNNNGNFTSPAFDASEPPAASGGYRIVLTIDKNVETCSVPNGANPHTLVGAETTQGNRFVGLRLNRATIAFRYVAIYRI